MKVFGQVLLLRLLVSVLQLAVAGLMLLLAGTAVIAFIARPREALAIIALLRLGSLTIHYPVAVFGTIAGALTVGWIVHRCRRRKVTPLLLLPAHGDRNL